MHLSWKFQCVTFSILLLMNNIYCIFSREFYHCDDPRGVRLPVFTGSTGQQQDQRLLPAQGQEQRARGALFRLRRHREENLRSVKTCTMFIQIETQKF